jgi:hypothetical protein
MLYSFLWATDSIINKPQQKYTGGPNIFDQFYNSIKNYKFPKKMWN